MKTRQTKRKPLSINHLLAGIEVLGRFTLQIATDLDKLTRRVRRIEAKTRKGK